MWPLTNNESSLRSRNQSNFLDMKFKVSKKDDNNDFSLLQNLTMTEADFNEFMPLRNQLVIATENSGQGENLSPVLIPTMSKDMDDQFKVALKMVDVVDRAKRKVWVTLLRYHVDKSESSYANVRLFARKKGTRSFNKLSMWNINVKTLSFYSM